MTEKLIDEVTSDPDKNALEKVVDRVVRTNSDLARKHIERFGGGKTGSELLTRLDRQYRATLTGSGAAVGAAAAAPGVGTAVGVALSGGEVVATLEATMLYVLSYAEVTGVHVQDIERRRTLLMAVLLGSSGQKTIEKMIGRTGPHWGRKVAEAVPLQTIRQINKVMGHNFVTRYGTKQGIVVLGRLAPFGIGIALGGVMGAVSSTVVIRATKRAFTS